MVKNGCSGPLLLALLVMLLTQTSDTMGVAVWGGGGGAGGEGEGRGENGLLPLSQAILHLITQRFVALELSLESRVSRLTDSAAKGEALISSLSDRLDKVDSLVEKVDALDARLTQETSSLRSTIAATNRDLHVMTTRLERMDMMEEAAEALRLVDAEEVEEEGQQEQEAVEAEGGVGEVLGVEGGVVSSSTTTTTNNNNNNNNNNNDNSSSRHTTRSSADLRIISSMISGSVTLEIQRTLPVLVDRSLTTFQNSLYKRISKNVAQLQEEVQEVREGLEHLSTQTLTTATEARQYIRQGEKNMQDAVTDIKNKVQSVYRDLSLKITSSSPLNSLESVLRQVNRSVAEGIARATEGLNVTLMDEAARWRGASDGEEAEEWGSQRAGTQLPPYDPVPHCPDPTTVATLLEVKDLLQSLLRKSEDLRRGLTKQTSEGLDLLELLHQRFAVLVRRMNTDPDSRQVLDEMQELKRLVDSSYREVIQAQTAFNVSCKRIQEEEPLLESKMTELLDKLLTNSNLGYKNYYKQLSELKEVVTRLGQRGTQTTGVLDPVRTRAEAEVLDDSGSVPVQVQEVIDDAVHVANHTLERLDMVMSFLIDVEANLLKKEWRDRRQKNAADQLVTAAKDLKGYAQEHIMQSFDMRSKLLELLEQLNASVTVSQSQCQTTTYAPISPLDLLGEAPTLTLPPRCTAALLHQLMILRVSQRRVQANTSQQPLSDASQDSQDHRGQEAREGNEEDEEGEEEDIPAWYTDPVFLSGNYGTPDRGLPVFREEEWVDMDDYDTETAVPAHSTATATTSPPHAMQRTSTNQPRSTTGDVFRYFGVP